MRLPIISDEMIPKVPFTKKNGTAVLKKPDRKQYNKIYRRLFWWQQPVQNVTLTHQWLQQFAKKHI